MKFSRRFTYLVLIVSALFALTTVVALASGATWTISNAPAAYWDGITSSADGTKLAAVASELPYDTNGSDYGYIYTSANGGMTWATSTAPQEYWNGVISSSNGADLAAIVDEGYIYTSTNGGETWATSTAPSETWEGIASSADGSKLAAAAYYNGSSGPGYIYTSTNGGMTWATSTAPAEYWEGIASSADGTKLAAVPYENASGGSGYIYTSTNGGMTWATSTAPAEEWGAITSSADGTKLAAAPYDANPGPGYIYTSTNGGMTWATSTAPQAYYYTITSSADGTKLAAAEYENGPTYSTGYVYTSDDGGATWTQQTGAGAVYWYMNDVASSADGTKLAAAQYEGPGYIYTATLSPTLTTSAASSISTTGATLNGSITDVGNGTSTTEGFVYGTDTSYGATTTESGSFGTGSFTADIASLVCNVAYHFAPYATNGYLAYGTDQTFTTSACPSSAPSGGGGGMIVGSGPTAPFAAGLPGYTPPRPQIDYPNGTVVYLSATTTASTSPPTTPITTSSPSTPAGPSPSYQFTVNRQLWDEGPDILALQQFLNTHGFEVAQSGPGSPGNETDFFGLLTYAALVKFQDAHAAEILTPVGLTQGSGYFGPATRAFVNNN